MASSGRNSLYDRIRKKHVAAEPEECVRQQWLHLMIEELNYPKDLISVEKGVKSPLYAQKTSFLRRTDIVCFAKNIHPDHALYPLLLIECKSGPLTQKAVDQVMGYNHTVKACFIAVANDREIRVGYYDAKTQKYCFISYLPSYPELIDAIRPKS